MLQKIHFTFFLVLIFNLLACSDNPSSTTNKESETTKNTVAKINIVATTGMIADAVKNVVGDLADVNALMGAGVDPHYYKASQGDLSKLKKADVIFYNGLLLEGKMQDILEKLAEKQAVFPVSAKIPADKLTSEAVEKKNTVDPHIWFDIELWMMAVQEITDQLSEKYPDKKAVFTKNGETYQSKLMTLHKEVKMAISKIPEKDRILLTSHDAFGYFSKAYDIRVAALQGISTVTEFGLKDVANMVDFIVKNKVKAIFTESTVSEKPMQAILKGCEEKGFQTKIGGTLFTDAMGEKGTEKGTYIGMVRHNVSTIIQALR